MKLRTTVNLSEELIKIIDLIAEKEHRNRSQQIEHILETYIDEHKKKEL